MTAPGEDIESRETQRESLRAWRTANAEKIVRALWPLLQHLEEANKAWLLAEIGSRHGELALVLARMMPWRDIVGFDGDLDGLRVASRAADSPTLHRLDFVRADIRSDAARLPIHGGYASGIVAVGAVAGLVADERGRLAAEMLRALRPKGSLLLAEPRAGWFGGAPAAICPPSGAFDAFLDILGGIEPITLVARRAKSGLDCAALKRAGG